MKKIAVPFPYMGSKGRFYEDIKQIFKDNYRENFVDLFAGGLSVPLNLKNDFKDIKVLANVKDEKMEALIKHSKNVYEIYQRALTYLFEKIGGELTSSRKMYSENRQLFDEVNRKFKEIYFKVCPCCGKKIEGESELKIFTPDEKLIIKLLMGFGGMSENLSNTFYSKNKDENLKKYLEQIQKIEVTTEPFQEKWSFSDSFIFLDPPYIQKTKMKEKNFIGYQYADCYGDEWSIEDDQRLVNFIKSNLKKNNVFLVFGSNENNLKKLIEKEIENPMFIEKIYKHQTFGNITDKYEWFCLIK